MAYQATSNPRGKKDNFAILKLFNQSQLRASSYEPGQPGWLCFRDLASLLLPS